MTYTVNSPIVHAPTRTLAEALAWLDVKAGPETEYATELWRLCTLVGLDPAILFAQAAHETADFSSVWWLNRRNPAGIGITGDTDQNAKSQTWANGIDAARAHIAHMLSYVAPYPGDWLSVWFSSLPNIDPIPGPGIYDKRFDAVREAGYRNTARTLSDLTGKWATDPKYAEKISAKASYIFPNRQEAQPVSTVYQIVGLPGPGIELPVPLSHQIIPLSQPKQRPGIKRDLPGYWVQHETANTAPGADAAMHSRWLNNGAGGATLSFHFAVDDGAIYQMIPIDEVTWQAADGSGPGNMSGISCELCVNAGIDTEKARHNAEALCAGIFKQLGLNVDRVKAHYDFNEGVPDRHHCPDTMLNDGYWPVTFKTNVAALLRGTESAKPKAAPIWWTPGAVGPQRRPSDGFMALAMLGEVTAKKPVVIRTTASAKAPAIVTLKQGEKRRIAGTMRAPDKAGTRWVFIETSPGSDEWGRARYSSFEERFPVL